MKSTILPRKATCASVLTFPNMLADISGVGTIRIIEAIRETGLKTRFYQASIERNVRQGA